MDILLRAPELHVVLGSSACLPAIVSDKTKINKEIYCFRCLLTGFTSRTCLKCNSFSKTDLRHVKPIDAQMTPTLSGSLNLPEHNATHDEYSSGRHSGTLEKGGRFTEAILSSRNDFFSAKDESCLHVLSHVDDTASLTFWNTPFKAKIYFNGQVLGQLFWLFELILFKHTLN